MKKQSRNDKIENCLVMIDAVESLPERAFVHDLRDWRCGSAACLGGWVAQHPHFQAKGIKPDPSDGSITESGRGPYLDSMDIATELFGDGTMFYSRKWNERDFSAKQLALNRLNQALDRLLVPL